jgi:MoCo/4Fe-4S cofactor protein with predicted Tat translocation signal
MSNTNQEHGGRDAAQRFWRSLDELADTPAFRERLEREFPQQAIGWSDDEDSVEGRRSFLKLMGASLALAGLSACTRQPTEQIVPYIRQPEELIPGKPLFFATAHTVGGVATGVLAESHEGRPTKIEGNPEHPASLGACDQYAQASVLQLYDPDRSKTLSFEGDIRSWSGFLGSLREILAAQKPKNGSGVRILTETITSPTLADQFRTMQRLYPAAKWHVWEPAGPHAARAGATQSFGQPVNTYYDFTNAKVVVSLDSDFLASGAASLRYARQFSAQRRVHGGRNEMNRLYVVEPFLTPTGTKADHRLPLRAGDVEEFAWALATGLGAANGPKQGENADIYKWIGAIVKDLQLNKGASVVVPGEYQPPIVHALAHVMNANLGNVGKTVFYTDPIEANPVDQLASLQDLVKDLDAGAVDLLLILGGNPVFTAPVELGMADRLKKARLRAHLSLYSNETSEVCQWNLPETHYLETWGDARAFDGTVTIQQPLIEPLYDGRSASQVLQMFTDTPELSPVDIVQMYWASQHGGGARPATRLQTSAPGSQTAARVQTAARKQVEAIAAAAAQSQPSNAPMALAPTTRTPVTGAYSPEFSSWWRTAIHDGIVPGTALPTKTPAIRGEAISQRAQPRRLEGKLEVIFRPDPAIYDGRFSNNAWLQEWPKPITSLTWDNAVFLSPATANRLNVQSGDMVRLTYQGRALRAPVWVQPGIVNGAATLHLGYGRTRAGNTGTGFGFNPFGLRTSNALWHDTGLNVEKTSGEYLFASVQLFHTLDSRRHTIHKADLEEYKKNPEAPHEGAEAPPRSLTMYPEWKYEGYAWGMSIDLNACTGCGACVVACQAENNVAVVGKDQVRRGRVMQWLRVDSYYEGSEANPSVYNQPVPCMHCEDAPCELVCPVQATTHSAEGLNDMVYNRCVGTRYCSNNCPYKVRRFNFYLFSDYETPSLKQLHNPDVTVRSRGVMEKCT